MTTKPHIDSAGRVVFPPCTSLLQSEWWAEAHRHYGYNVVRMSRILCVPQSKLNDLIIYEILTDRAHSSTNLMVTEEEAI